MAETPIPRISATAACGVVALVSRVNSSPLGKNVSQLANTAWRTARTSGSRTTSSRMFGSKETEPPPLFTNSIAVVTISTIWGDESEAPDTCKWSHSLSSSNPASVNRN